MHRKILAYLVGIVPLRLRRIIVPLMAVFTIKLTSKNTKNAFFNKIVRKYLHI